MNTPVSNAYATLDAFVDRELLRLNVPGAALAVVEGERIVHFRGFGQTEPYGSATSGGAPSPQTPFFIGSVTKSFTALAIMQLVEQGKVDLDAPVQRYLPWFRVADPEASASMTVRHLLNQTSGFSMTVGSAALGDLDDRPDAAERQARALTTFRHTRPAGAAFDYSNVNFNLLGLIVEAASGEPYADYVQNCIFNPLQMTHSYATKAEARQDGLATGHRYWFWRPVPEPDLPVPIGSLAAGTLISSAEDLAHYVIANLNGGCFEGVQVLSPAGIAEMHRGAVAVNQMGFSTSQYGMGWFVSDLDGEQAVWHSGLTPDFTAFVGLLPGQRKGVILLLNAGHFWMEPISNELGVAATALLAGKPEPESGLPWLKHVPAIQRALLLIPLLQLIGVALTLRRVRGWQADPPSRPGAARTWGLHVLPPLLPDLSLAAVPVLLRRSPLAGFLKFFMPDGWWLASICGGFAAVWAVLRTVLVLAGARPKKEHTDHA